MFPSEPALNVAFAVKRYVPATGMVSVPSRSKSYAVLKWIWSLVLASYDKGGAGRPQRTLPVASNPCTNVPAGHDCADFANDCGGSPFQITSCCPLLHDARSLSM